MENYKFMRNKSADNRNKTSYNVKSVRKLFVAICYDLHLYSLKSLQTYSR